MASPTDLDQHIANSEPAALRVGDAMRLLPLVLLRHDDRAQHTYADWQARIVCYEDAGVFTEAAALRSLVDDTAQLNALVCALKMQRYRRWLPEDASMGVSTRSKARPGGGHGAGRARLGEARQAT
jgi:hypothetical protein